MRPEMSHLYLWHSGETDYISFFRQFMPKDNLPKFFVQVGELMEQVFKKPYPLIKEFHEVRRALMNGN